MNEQKWLVCSIEHNGWWNPYHQGYTLDRNKAGRYDWAEALEIVRNANFRSGNRPNEALVLE